MRRFARTQAQVRASSETLPNGSKKNLRPGQNRQKPSKRALSGRVLLNGRLLALVRRSRSRPRNRISTAAGGGSSPHESAKNANEECQTLQFGILRSL